MYTIRIRQYSIYNYLDQMTVIVLLLVCDYNIKITAIKQESTMQKQKNNRQRPKILSYQQCQSEYNEHIELVPKLTDNSHTPINKKEKQQNKNTNIVYSTTNGNNSTYEDMLKLCHKYRKQNQQLQYRNRELQNTIKLMQSQSSITQLLYHNSSNNINQNASQGGQGVDRIRYLEDEYRLYKDNLYRQSKKQIRNLYKFVDYLYLCFQEYVRTNNSKYGQVIRTINQKGIKNFLATNKNMNNVNSLNKFIELIEQQVDNPGSNKPNKTQQQQQTICSNYSSSQANTYLQIFNDEIQLTKQFQLHQTQMLRKKIKQLNNVIQTLIKLYRQQLCMIKQTAKGTSYAIVQQLKECLYKNCKVITGENNEKQKPNTNQSINQSQKGTFNNHKLQQKVGKNSKSSKSSFTRLNKRLSLGGSMNVTQNDGKYARPPTSIKKPDDGQAENKNRLNISCSMGMQNNKQNKKDNSNTKYLYANINQLKGQKSKQQKHLNVGNPTPKNYRSQIKSLSNSVTKSKIKN